MGGPHRNLVVEPRQPLQGAVLRAGQLLRAVRRHEVGAGRGAHEQGSAGEHPQRSRVVQQLEGQVLVGVPRSGQGTQAQTAQVDLVTVDEARVRVLPVPRRRGQHLRPLRASELHRAGQVVRVQVGVGGVRHPQPVLARGVVQGAEVATGIHGQRATVVQVDQVGGVAQSLVHERDDADVAHEPYPTSFHGTME
jgi:hypothetical protein